MDFHRLRMLRELADHGTVAAVADVLSMTPSAVSQQLKTLQREAGVTLLEPAGRRVRLTDAGRVLVGHADRVLAALERAHADMDSYRNTPRGQVTVSFFPSGAAMLLAPLIAHAGARGVEVLGRDIDVPAAHAPQQLTEFDVVVVHRDDRDTSSWEPRFSSRVLLREPLDVLMWPTHPLATRSSVELSELAGQQWVGVAGGLMVDDAFRSMATLTGSTPRIIQRVNDFRVAEELVAAQVGIALLPRYVVLARDLIRVPIGDIRLARRIEAITRSGAESRPAIALVLAQLGAIAAEFAAPTSE
ncbi:LysR family transcriptional regulator [Mycolicibacterium sp. 22603]|uniref:LysR family transcriptional regulator n=1 Tax=Mycolicibacterium sp. 22603 TaxID=3453950 RepID=UPI003F849239